MNRTIVFIVVGLMLMVAIICGCVLVIIAPEGFLTFTGFIFSAFALITGFSVTLYGLAKTNEKLSKVEEQTNGRLTFRDKRIRELEKALIERGHGDVVANAVVESPHD